MAFFRVIKASTTEAGAVSDATMTDAIVELLYDSPAQFHLWMLDVTAAAADSGDDLDVTVEGSLDGSLWFEVVSFTQVLGEGSAIQHYEPVQPNLNTNSFTGASTVAAGASIAVFAKYYRVRWTITDTGANSSFTFSVGVFAN